jgi:glycerophosphoryl diester phosphodiesterase
MKKIIFAVMLLAGFVASAQPKVVGHRGCRDVEGQYENTISSLKYAYEVGCDAVEFDVQMTKDGQIIVFHGPKVPGHKKTIHEMTFKEARAVVLPGGFQMPTLEEYFEVAKQLGDMPVILELKGQPTPEKNVEAAKKVVAIAQKCGMTPQKLEYTSFSRTVLTTINEQVKGFKTIYLASGVHVKPASYAKEMGFTGISYDLNAWMNRPEILEEARQLGIETTVWLTNHYEVIDWATRHKADYVSTDFPAPAVQYVKGMKGYGK